MASSLGKSDQTTRRRASVDSSPNQNGRQQQRRRTSQGASPQLGRVISLGPEHHIVQQQHDNRVLSSIAFVKPSTRVEDSSFADGTYIVTIEEGCSEENGSYGPDLSSGGINRIRGGGSVARSVSTVAPGDGVSVSWSVFSGRSDSSNIWARIEESIRRTESILLEEEKSIKKKRSKSWVRWCAKTIAGMVILSALGWSVSHLVSEKDDSIFALFLENNLLGRLFGNNHAEEQKDYTLTDRKLPRRADEEKIGEIFTSLQESPEKNHETEMMVPLKLEQNHKMAYPSSEDLPGTDRFYEHVSLREEKDRERAQRIHAKEQRIRAQEEARQYAPR